jgi:hypothetical protein
MTVSSDTPEKPVRSPLRAPQLRRRCHLTMTVHPDTISRLAFLTNRYKLPVGKIVDHLVSSLNRCFSTAGDPEILTCINGEVCRMARRDVPDVL